MVGEEGVVEKVIHGTNCLALFRLVAILYALLFPWNFPLLMSYHVRKDIMEGVYMPHCPTIILFGRIPVEYSCHIYEKILTYYCGPIFP